MKETLSPTSRFYSVSSVFPLVHDCQDKKNTISTIPKTDPWTSFPIEPTHNKETIHPDRQHQTHIPDLEHRIRAYVPHDLSGTVLKEDSPSQALRESASVHRGSYCGRAVGIVSLLRTYF